MIWWKLRIEPLSRKNNILTDCTLRKQTNRILIQKNTKKKSYEKKTKENALQKGKATKEKVCLIRFSCLHKRWCYGKECLSVLFPFIPSICCF